MRKLLVLMLVLGIASVASAQLTLSVNGVDDPEDSTITMTTSETATIDIYGDGTYPDPGYTFILGIDLTSTGSGSLDITNAVILYAGNTTSIGEVDNEEAATDFFGIENPFIEIELTDLVSPPAEPLKLTGKLVDLIKFTCDGVGDVILILYDADGVEMDRQTIHQIPEPMTIALLGLGGLFLRRRK